MKARSCLSVIARISISGTFLFAGIQKAAHPAQLESEIMRYRLVPEWLGWASATYLPYLEVICGAALLFSRTRRAAQLILGALLFTFLLAIASAWIRGLDINCGCFGSKNSGGSDYLWWLVRDSALLLVLCLANLEHARHQTTNPTSNL